ncbi:MAG: alpha/beta fold hydrolase [Pyrinomonadaceae bacterium]
MTIDLRGVGQRRFCIFDRSVARVTIEVGRTSAKHTAPACLIVLVLLAGAVAAQEGPASYSTPPLGSALESYPYPHPVKFLPFEIEGEPVRMAYMDVPAAAGGAAGGRAVVLLHGKNFYGSYWEGTIRALAAAGHRVIVPDQIGFGKSSKPDINYSFDLLAANTARLLDHLKVERAAIVGHSMGGMLAVRFARNYPARTTHLVLANPIGLEDYRFKVPPQPTEKIYQNELNEIDPAKIRAFFRRYVVEWKPEVYERFVEVRSRIAHGGEYPRWARSAALTYQMIYQQPVRHEFGLLRVPTLLIIGQEDRTAVGKNFAPPEVAQTLGQYPQLGREAARDIPGARLVELQQVGHLPHLEAPDRFQSELIGFLR